MGLGKVLGTTRRAYFNAPREGGERGARAARKWRVKVQKGEVNMLHHRYEVLWMDGDLGCMI
jgi:hypothetical protein